MAASAEKYFAFKYSFTETKITANIRYSKIVIVAAVKSAKDLIECNSVFGL